MKTRLLQLAVMAICVAALSCQKPGENFSFGQESLSELSVSSITASCPPIPLSTSITTPTTLTTGNSYLLTGVTVVTGTTLTIQPGVVIFADAGAALVIGRTSTINAAGECDNPIIFTSSEAAGSRQPGDWRGVFLLGQAPNNHSNSLNIPINGTNHVAGGNSPTSSIGTFTYVQILYAGEGGGAGSDRRAESALVMASLGSGSTVHHVQVSETDKDGVGLFGGTFFPTEIVVHKARRTDFMVSFGYTGNAQYLAGFKHNATVNTTNAVSYAMDISNDLFNTTSTSTPLTYPTFSNLSFLGGEFCNGDDGFTDAINYKNNGNGRIYNSVVSSFSQYALVLSGNLVMGNTSGSPQFQFSYNSFHQITNPQQYFNTPATWVGCGVDIDDWIQGTALLGCEEAGNQFTVTTLGIATNDVCVDCGSITPGFPDFSLGTNTLTAPVYTWDTGSAFAHPTHRGAFGTSPWIEACWANFCPQQTNYCL